MNLEEKIIKRFAPDSTLLDMCLEDNAYCIRIINQLPKSEDFRYFTKGFDQIISYYITEALLSPVAWIRERAVELSKENK